MEKKSISSKLGLSKLKIQRIDSKLRHLQYNRTSSSMLYGLGTGILISSILVFSGMIDDHIDHYAPQFNELIEAKMNFAQYLDKKENLNLAEVLYNEVRVLCMVYAIADHVDERGHIIMDTWGKRCNKIMMICEKTPVNNTENVFVVENPDGFERFRVALDHVYKNNLEEFDWIIKTEDASYVVLENLRHLLYQYNHEWPVVIGQRIIDGDRMVGEFAFSKKALLDLMQETFNDTTKCATWGYTDAELIKCLHNANVTKVDAADEEGRGRFFKLSPQNYLIPDQPPTEIENYVVKFKQGPTTCCSDRLAVMSNWEQHNLYYLEYFIYKVHAFGRHRRPEPLPKKLSFEDVLKKSQSEIIN